jgi:hypothetical protein
LLKVVSLVNIKPANCSTVELIVTSLEPDDIFINLPPSKLLNCKSFPTFCAKIAEPVPKFEAVVIALADAKIFVSTYTLTAF